MQYIIDQGVPWATDNVLDQLEGNYGYLSMQKYSSNVVEKCLKFSGDEQRARIIRELIDNSQLGQILQDPYGNYVVQSALAESKVRFLNYFLIRGYQYYLLALSLYMCNYGC